MKLVKALRKRRARRPGRPRKKINPGQVEELASIQCSYAEMASVLGCDPSTLSRNFAQAIEKGRERGKESLKRAQFKLAMGGNVTMLIWLGKQHLQQRDHHDVRVGDLTSLSDAELEAIAVGRSR